MQNKSQFQHETNADPQQNCEIRSRFAVAVLVTHGRYQQAHTDDVGIHFLRRTLTFLLDAAALLVPAAKPLPPGAPKLLLKVGAGAEVACPKAGAG